MRSLSQDGSGHFHQFGIEVFGTSDMIADAEVICLANDFLTELGVNETELRINSVGCPECRSKYREALKDFLRPRYEELCGTCKDRFERNPMRILDCKFGNMSGNRKRRSAYAGLSLRRLPRRF